MKGTEFRIQKLNEQIQVILLKPEVKLTTDIFELNFTKFSLQALQIADYIINVCDLEKHLCQLFTKLINNLKESRNHKPMNEQEEEIQRGDDEITYFLNTRKPAKPPSNFEELNYYLNQMEIKEKDTREFIQNLSRLRQPEIHEKRKMPHIEVDLQDKNTQTDVIWVQNLEMNEKSDIINVETLFRSIPLYQRYLKQFNEKQNKFQTNILIAQKKISSQEKKQNQQKNIPEPKEQQVKANQETVKRNSKQSKPKRKHESNSIIAKKTFQPKQNLNKRSLVIQSTNFTNISANIKQIKQTHSAFCTPTKQLQKNEIQETPNTKKANYLDSAQISEKDSKAATENSQSIKELTIEQNQNTQLKIQDEQIIPKRKDNRKNTAKSIKTPKAKLEQYLTKEEEVQTESILEQLPKEIPKEMPIQKPKESVEEVMTKKEENIQQKFPHQKQKKKQLDIQLDPELNLPDLGNRYASLGEEILNLKKPRKSEQSKTSRNQEGLPESITKLSKFQNLMEDKQNNGSGKLSIHNRENFVNSSHSRFPKKQKMLSKLNTIHRESQITDEENVSLTKFKPTLKQNNRKYDKIDLQGLEEKFKIKNIQNRFVSKLASFHKSSAPQNLPKIKKENKKKVFCQQSFPNGTDCELQLDGSEDDLLENLDPKLIQKELHGKQVLITNKINQLQKHGKLNHAQIKFYVELMEKLHRQHCGKDCKHLERFYRNMKWNTMWNNRVPLILPTRKIGFFS